MPHSSGVKTHLLRATTSGRHIRNNPCVMVYSLVASRQAKGGSIPMVSDSDAGCFPKLGRIRKENGLGAKGRCDECGERCYRSGEALQDRTLWNESVEDARQVKGDLGYQNRRPH